MADEALTTPVPSGTHIRTHEVVMFIKYPVVGSGGAAAGSRSLRIRADDPALTQAQKNAVINFATNAAQIVGWIA